MGSEIRPVSNSHRPTSITIRIIPSSDKEFLPGVLFHSWTFFHIARMFLNWTQP